LGAIIADPSFSPVAVNALRNKRSIIAGEIEMHNREIDRLRSELVHLDVDWCWNQPATVRGKNPELHRRDEMGNKVYRPSYGKQGSMSWQIDHRRAVAAGGTVDRRNLRILQTGANQRKSDKP
jgi:hypothetical protein